MKSAAEAVRPVLHDRSGLDPEYRADLGHTKRFLERFAADPGFRQAIGEDPQAHVRWNLRKSAQELRPLWDETWRIEGLTCSDIDSHSLSVARFRAFHREKLALVPALRALGEVEDPDWQAWRRRQILRCLSHLGPKARQLVHAPFCIELGKGCSVGCWFCAVSAAKLGEQWAYSATNKAFWRDCLAVLQDIFGTASKAGYCYWGNDPLDNPEYESFLVDFHEVIGSFPQTTTAQPDKHIDRVRNLIRMSEERGGLMDRFSVLTLSQWNRIHEAFDASEMLFVECVPQNKEAYGTRKVVAGRALERERKLVAQGKVEPTPTDETSTIACVSGFYLNMVDRVVQLITPCHADERWPLGHWILEQDTFTDARSLERLLKRMGTTHKRASLRTQDPLRLRRDLEAHLTDQGLVAATRYSRHEVNLEPSLRPLAEALLAGDCTVGEVALSLDHPLPETFHALNVLLFDRGLLDEEPQFNPTARPNEGAA